MGRIAALLIVALAGQAAAGQQAAAFLGQGFRDCAAFNRALAATDFADEPELFLCHDFVYQPLLIYGYIRFAGRRAFGMTLVTNRHGACTGTGETAWSRAGGRRHVSASGRFECADGSVGGLAFEADVFVEPGRSVHAGTAFGGIDGHRTRSNVDERISDDLRVYSKALAGELGR